LQKNSLKGFVEKDTRISRNFVVKLKEMFESQKIIFDRKISKGLIILLNFISLSSLKG